MKERKLRIEDAFFATKAAVEEGILPGGGVALLRASEILGKVKTENEDKRVGVDIVRCALDAPLKQIVENAGADGAVVVERIRGNRDPEFGFDADSMEYVNLMKAGIIGPTKVVRADLQNAASVASLLLTTEALVAEIPEKRACRLAEWRGGLRRRRVLSHSQWTWRP